MIGHFKFREEHAPEEILQLREQIQGKLSLLVSRKTQSLHHLQIESSYLRLRRKGTSSYSIECDLVRIFLFHYWRVLIPEVTYSS